VSTKSYSFPDIDRFTPKLATAVDMRKRFDEDCERLRAFMASAIITSEEIESLLKGLKGR
jgi:hypothetical protein